MPSINVVSFLIEFWISLLNKKQESQSSGFDYRYIRVKLCRYVGKIHSVGGGGGGGGKGLW